MGEQRLLALGVKVILMVALVAPCTLAAWAAAGVVSGWTGIDVRSCFVGLTLLFILLPGCAVVICSPRFELPRTERALGEVDRVRFAFEEEVYGNLPAHGQLPFMGIDAAVRLYDRWAGEDLVRHLREKLANDSSAVGLVHHASVLGSLGFLEQAREVLERAGESQREVAFAIGEAEVVELSGDLLGAASRCADVARGSGLSGESQAVLLAKTVALRTRAGDLEGARKTAGEYLRGGASPEARLYFLYQLADLPLRWGCENYLEDALRHIEAALALKPGDPSFKRMKGALLFEALRREEAEHWLRACLRETSDPEDLSVCHFYLALIERKRGRLLEAKRLAQRIWPERVQWLKARLQREFAL